MSTTAIFSEILAIGVQTALLMGIALAAVADFGPVISGAQGWEAAATVVLLASAYVLGVVTDRLADSLLTPLRDRISKRNADEFKAMRRRILETQTPLSSFLEYQRSRMRLIRGTILNLILALPMTVIFLLRRGPDDPSGAILIASLVIGVLTGVCVFAFFEIANAQDRWLRLISGPRESERGVDASA